MKKALSILLFIASFPIVAILLFFWVIKAIIETKKSMDYEKSDTV